MKIRCSSIGKIMTNPRSKSELLSQTTKSYIQELALEHLYGIKKDISSRYLEKGKEVEQASIELTERVLDLGFVTKNENYFENDYIKGTPDIITDKMVIDVKSSWNALTFPWFEDELPNKDYYYQVQGYLWLTGKQFGMVAYCLVNTPENIVNDEIRRASWAKYEIEPSEETIRDVMAAHNFDGISEDRRVKAYLFNYDQHVVDQIKERILQCREYFNTLIK